MCIHPEGMEGSLPLLSPVLFGGANPITNSFCITTTHHQVRGDSLFCPRSMCEMEERMWVSEGSHSSPSTARSERTGVSNWIGLSSGVD